MPTDALTSPHVEYQRQPLQIGEWRVEPVQDRMQRGDEVVYLKPRAMEVLLYMARKAPNPVDVNEFIEQLWFPNVVGNENVKVIINKLRAALGESAP